MKTSVAKIKKLFRLRPTLALVLGSGFHHALRGLAVYAEIPWSVFEKCAVIR